MVWKKRLIIMRRRFVLKTKMIIRGFFIVR